MRSNRGQGLGKYVGGLSEFGVLGFDFGKMITTGEGELCFPRRKVMEKMLECIMIMVTKIFLVCQEG